MNRLGFKTVVYDGEVCLGEVDAIPLKDENFRFPNNEIRIQHITPNSERCHPLAVLQTISSSPVFCKLEPFTNSSIDCTHLINLHASCFYHLKTAVVLVENEEVHLVAMPSRQKKFPCFWCYSVTPGLYSACLGMLNLRCLAIVFDLDETLIVANTMKTFEDRIEALRNWIMRDPDTIRSSGMSVELKRYMEDRALLKQYADNDCVVDGGGKIYRIQSEEVPKLNNSQEIVARPVIRIPEKNIILTRIKPEIRDTSVLVRLRPAWEELKSYLTAKGRKRFEVYVCTMAERDYALEMWRLLDPEARLISSKQQLDRVFCVKSGARKSLPNVFQGGNCHPKLAMVIDDRLKVWEEKDQPRVHVVPAFSPYYAPQAEISTAVAVPVLCVARNVACNVRGGFFKEFDENLLQKISEVHYEDDVVRVPSAPDVSNFLMPEDSGFPSNGSTNGPSFPEGVNGPEVAQRLKSNMWDGSWLGAQPFRVQNHLEEKSFSKFTPCDPLSNILDPKPESSEPVANVSCLPSRSALLFERNNFLGPTIREDTSSSESDHDAKRRFPLVHRGPDIRHQGSIAISPLPRLPEQNFAPPAQFQGGWLVEDLNKGQINGQTPALVQESEAVRNDKQLARQHSHGHGTSTSVAPGLSVQVTQLRNEEANLRPEGHKQNLPLGDQIIGLGSDGSQNILSGSGRENQTEGARWNFSPAISIGVLQEIGRRCNSKVEFRPLVSTCEDLQFSFEVLFSGEKIGSGMGKIRKDAQQQAAENALKSLADKYVSYIGLRSGPVGREVDRRSPRNENGFIWDMDEPGSHEQPVGNGLLKKKASDS